MTSPDPPDLFTELPILEEIGAELERILEVDAAHAQHPRSTRRVPVRWRGLRPLALVFALVLGGTAVALAATGVFRIGTPLKPGAPVVATQNNGAAIAGSARLLLRVPDPRGGLLWAVRVVRTTRDETCIQVGRFAFATIGVLGQDGAFANDGRFHPISENVDNPLSCGSSDANGNAFVNDVLQNLPASGYDRGCRLADATALRQHPLLSRALAQDQSRLRQAPVCPAADLRNVFYGLLGPDALSVTYATPNGGLATTRTAGPDGAYLIVMPRIPGAKLCGATRVGCPLDTMSIGNGIWADGVIRVVRYRDGHACRLNASLPLGQQQDCPNVGYVAPATQRLTVTGVESPISVRKDPALRANAQVTVSFVSRVAIRSSGDYYHFEIDNPTHPNPNPGLQHPSLCSPNIGVDFLTYSDYQPGQRVSDTQTLPPCRGTFHGAITLIINGDSQDHLPGGIGATRINVGEFTVNEP